MVAELLRPVTAILAQRHFLGQPVELLLALPKFIGPGIFEGLVDLGGLKKGHMGYSAKSFLPLSHREREGPAPSGVGG
jgi:hypothetical protein